VAMISITTAGGDDGANWHAGVELDVVGRREREVAKQRRPGRRELVAGKPFEHARQRMRDGGEAGRVGDPRDGDVRGIVVASTRARLVVSVGCAAAARSRS